MKTIVMKFGGAALETPAHFGEVCAVIDARRGEYERVVVVVSAMQGMTDELEGLARQVAKEPARREMDMLISVGERISMSLLAMALEERGISAVSLTGSQSGIITSGDHNAAEIVAVRPTRIEKHLDEGKVVIVAGFQGVSEDKEITTLGRGGSDTSAVALGAALAAEKVEFFKDVLGVYSDDPKKNGGATLLEAISYEEALQFSEFVIHPASILLASKKGLPLHVMSFRKDQWRHYPGTSIGNKVR